MPNETFPIFNCDVIEFKTVEVTENREIIKESLKNIFPHFPDPNEKGCLEEKLKFSDKDGEWFLSIKYYSQASQHYENKPIFQFTVDNQKDNNFSSYCFDLSRQGNIEKIERLSKQKVSIYNSAWSEAYGSVVKGLALFVKK